MIFQPLLCTQLASPVISSLRFQGWMRTYSAFATRDGVERSDPPCASTSSWPRLSY